MVGTRNHPKDFKPPPENESPRKRSTRSSTAATETKEEPKPTSPVVKIERPTSPASPPPPSSNAFSRTARYVGASSSSSAPPPRRAGAWSHTPSNLTLLWLAVSLPLVIWDTAYILLRPHTLPGGSLHKLLWAPYALYGEVDSVYSAAAYHAGLGFTAAQGTMNALETTAYLVYLYMVYTYGRPEARQGTGAPDKNWAGKLAESRTMYGRTAVVAVLLNYTTLVITLSKSVLYWFNEAYAGYYVFRNSSLLRIIFIYVLPNGAWIVVPSYLLYVFGKEILEGLETAAEGAKKSR